MQDAPFAALLEEPASRLRVLAQLDATFILATDGDALVLVDQHAAHERIAYETIERGGRGAFATEPLLIPRIVELDATQAEALEGALEDLRAGGVEIEPFGEMAYRILATPAGYDARGFDLAGFLDDVRGDGARSAEGGSGLAARERVWATLACHSVVRAGDRLDELEMTALVRRLEHCRNPMHCPHGRPTIVRLESEAIARLFKRT